MREFQKPGSPIDRSAKLTSLRRPIKLSTPPHTPPAEELSSLPWIQPPRDPTWARRLVKLSRLRDTANRALGVLLIMARTGPSRPRSWLYALLFRLGVLDEDPRLAPELPSLACLPWGARPVTAPPPEPPPGTDGPWPQAPVFHPGLYPAVLRLDQRDVEDHLRATALRYLGQIVSLTPRAAWRARVGPRVAPVDDALFSQILTETSLAQHLRHALRDADRLSFAAHVHADREYSTIDFSGVAPGPTLPGIELAPTVTLFERCGPGAFTVRAIQVDDTVYDPSDTERWPLARYQVLSGVHLQHTIIVHPRLHFPGDVINAVSRSVLPEGHVLARLIRPHTRYSLGLNRAVTHHRRSVLHNSQREIYAPLPLDSDGTCAALTLGREGMPDNPNYPAYDFWGVEHDEGTAFGRYCQAWQQAFEDFATEVTREIVAGDPAVLRWADAISEWVPGFPASDAIFVGDTLARALGRYLAAVTALHSGDHHSYASIPIEYLPMRLRQAPQDPAPPLSLRKLVGPEGYFRHRLCHQMFFVPVVIESLDEVRYEFLAPHARAAAERFASARARLDAQWAGSGFPASYQIASSIQY